MWLGEAELLVGLADHGTLDAKPRVKGRLTRERRTRLPVASIKNNGGAAGRRGSLFLFLLLLVLVLVPKLSQTAAV